ncbi:MAG: hypothetical protein V3G42_04765 [Oscillospiraceae bacterium]
MKKIFSLLLAVMLLCGIFTACGNISQTYADYVQAVMDCTYHNDTAQYISLTGSTEQQAQMLYQNEVHSVVAMICQKFDVDVNSLPESTYDEYSDFAENLLNSITYHAEPSIKANNSYQVTLTAQPLEFWDTVFVYVENAYVSEFLPQFGRIEDTNSPEYADTLSRWGEKVVNILNEHFSELTFQESQYITIQIQPDTTGHYNISTHQWRIVDRFLLGLE